MRFDGMLDNKDTTKGEFFSDAKGLTNGVITHIHWLQGGTAQLTCEGIDVLGDDFWLKESRVVPLCTLGQLRQPRKKVEPLPRYKCTAACTCRCGKPVVPLACDEPGEKCEPSSVFHGWTLDPDGKCIENKCKCMARMIGLPEALGGPAKWGKWTGDKIRIKSLDATGPGCLTPGFEGCMKCPKGTSLTPTGPRTMACQPTQCLCPGGTASSGDECPKLYGQHCRNCNKGFQMVSTREKYGYRWRECIPLCWCRHGETSGDLCKGPSELCVSCDQGYAMLLCPGRVCKKVCQCENGGTSSFLEIRVFSSSEIDSFVLASPPSAASRLPYPDEAAERECARRSSSASSPLEAEFLLKGIVGPFLGMVGLKANVMQRLC